MKEDCLLPGKQNPTPEEYIVGDTTKSHGEWAVSKSKMRWSCVETAGVPKAQRLVRSGVLGNNAPRQQAFTPEPHSPSHRA